MIKKSYDLLFVTHINAFYKVNLYNEISKNKKIFVIFLSTKSSIRQGDFCKEHINFEHVFLSKDSLEESYGFLNSLKILNILIKFKCSHILINGWDRLEFWIVALLSFFKADLSLVCESHKTGKYLVIKKIMLALCDSVFASGKMHRAMIRKLNRKIKVYITNGVGIPNYPITKNQKSSHSNLKKQLIYIGRDYSEKNLLKTVNFFGKYFSDDIDLHLYGSNFDSIRESICKYDNIFIYGYVNNILLSEIIGNSDGLVLLSTYEPWGLVVEEALLMNIRVLVSSEVGAKELINKNNGLILSPDLQETDVKKVKFFLSKKEVDIVFSDQIYKKDKEQVMTYVENL